MWGDPFLLKVEQFLDRVVQWSTADSLRLQRSCSSVASYITSSLLSSIFFDMFSSPFSLDQQSF
jgi:hypothetical protein